MNTTGSAPALILAACLAACAEARPDASPTPTPVPTPHPGPARLDVIHRSGTGLVSGADARPVVLRGVCFGNEVWGNPSVPPTQHHDETDLGRVQAMHMNAIRFYMNYALFESDTSPYAYRQSGWDWLDRNVRWAAAHGVYLILNLHVPQGGFQSLGEGLALWNVPENQRRLRALMHPGHAVKPVDALSQTAKGRQEPGGGAGIADEQFERLLRRASARYLSVQAINGDRPVGGLLRVQIDIHQEIQVAQAIDHDLGVLAPEGAAQHGFTFGQSGQHQGSVRDAFRAGHGDYRRGWRDPGDDLDERGNGHAGGYSGELP